MFHCILQCDCEFIGTAERPTDEDTTSVREFDQVTASVSTMHPVFDPTNIID